MDRTCRVGRTWDDYLKFVEGNPGVRVVEMDTVEGARGGKVLPTLIFNPFNFMPAFPVDAKTSECVPGVFAAIVATLRGLCPETASRRAEPTSRTAWEAVLGTTQCTFGTTQCDHVPSRHSFSRFYSDKSPKNVCWHEVGWREASGAAVAEPFCQPSEFPYPAVQ